MLILESILNVRYLVIHVTRDFSKNQLPNYDKVMKCYLFVRNEMKSNNGKDFSVSVIASEVAEKVQAI